jgi:hypothetical protein
LGTRANHGSKLTGKNNAMMKSFVFIFFFLFTTSLFSQLQLTGFVIDQTTKQPIEYANIGIADKGIGTVCDQQGKFTLTIPAEDENSILTITRLGYQTTTLSIAKNNDVAKMVIALAPEVKELNEFSFSGKDKIELGYHKQDDAAKGFFKVEGLGMEGGTLIRNTDTVQLTHFNMNILELPYDSMKFRLNLYSVNKGVPGEKLNKKEIYFILQKDQLGIFRLPFEQNITPTGNFICTLELIEIFGEIDKDARFTFSAIIDKKGLIYNKGISLGKWKKIRKYSLCFWLEGKK